MSLPSDIVSQGINYSLLARLLRQSVVNAVDSGTATGSTSTTLTDATKSWDTNQWVNYLVEIVGGTGAGQIRKITSNTSNTLTVDTAWATNPDTTSVYAIVFAGAGTVNVASLPSVTIGNPLDASGNLKVSVQNVPSVAVSSLPSIPAGSNNIGSVNVANQPPVTLQTDNIGLAKASQITPILKGQLFNATYGTANSNFFSTALSPTNTPCMFRIYIVMSASGILTLTRTQGTTTVSEQLNGGNALTANAGYLFDVPVDAGETINLQYSVTGTILKCTVREIDGGIA